MLLRLSVLLLLVSVAYGQTIQYGICRVLPTAGGGVNVNGTVRFVQMGANLQVTVDLVGLQPNAKHGIHVHSFGDMGPSGAGGHWTAQNNVANANNHGCYPNVNRHNGDIGNITADATGTISTTLSRDLISLKDGGTSIIGRAIILHALADDCAGTAGNAGARIGHCVIGVGNPDRWAGVTGTSNEAAADVISTKANCFFRGTTNAPTVSGQAFFANVNGGVQVTAQISGLVADSVHGFHIHAFGDITGEDGTAAAGHFVGAGSTTHGYPISALKHDGDLGNLKFYDANTQSHYYQAVLPQLSLGAGANSIIGRGMIIHAVIDDGCSQPTGAAGSRLAQCVIGIANSASNPPNVPGGCCIPDSLPSCMGAPTPAPTAAGGSPTPAPGPDDSGSSSLSSSAPLLLLLASLLLLL